MVKWQFWSFLITQVFIILLTQLLCGFYNRKVSKNIIRGNWNLKEERALGERIWWQKNFQLWAESWIFWYLKKKKVKTERSDAAQGPQTSDGERRQEGPQPGHEEPPSGRGAVDGGEMSVANRRKMRPAQSGFYRCLLCYLHILRKPTAKIHTSSGSLRWMWFHSQKRRSLGPKNDWQ